MPVAKRLLVASRIRQPPPTGFSWIDRRFLREGFDKPLGSSELLLYFFLCAVADKDGLSFYGEKKIAATLKIPRACVERSRGALERQNLIAYRAPLYQVLSLESEPPENPMNSNGRIQSDQPRSFGEILRGLR